MKKTILLLMTLMCFISTRADIPLRGDVVIYGKTEMRKKVTGLDTVMAPFIVIDSLSVDGQKIMHATGDSLAALEFVRNYVQTYDQDTTKSDVFTTKSGGFTTFKAEARSLWLTADFSNRLEVNDEGSLTYVDVKDDVVTLYAGRVSEFRPDSIVFRTRFKVQSSDVVSYTYDFDTNKFRIYYDNDEKFKIGEDTARSYVPFYAKKLVVDSDNGSTTIDDAFKVESDDDSYGFIFDTNGVFTTYDKSDGTEWGGFDLTQGYMQFYGNDADDNYWEVRADDEYVKFYLDGSTKYYFTGDSSNIVGLNRTISSDQTIYVRKNTGNDETGDGSVGSPYATIDKALRTFDRIVDCNVTIDFDTIDWNITTTMSLSEKSLIGVGKFTIQGSGYNTLISSASFTTDATITQKYAVTGTFDITEDEMIGYFAYDGNNSYPIVANTAGTNSSTMYLTRGERTRSMDIVQWIGVINLLDAQALDFDFQSVSGHEFLIKQCEIKRTGDITYFNSTQPKEYEEVYFNMTGSMKMGEYPTSRYFQHSFRNCLIRSSGSSIYTLRTIRYNGYLNLFRTAIVNTVNATGHVTPILTDGYANTMFNLFDVAIRASNTGGIKLENLASVYLRGEVLFYDCSHALYVEYPGYNPVIYSNPNTDDKREFNLVNTPYVVNNIYSGFNMSIDNVKTDGTYSFCECSGTDLRYLDHTDRIDIEIRDKDIYREIGRVSSTLIDDDTTNITIGDSLQNNCITVEYYCTRSDSSSTGRVSVISSAVGLKTTHDIDTGFDIGLSFADSEYDVDDKIIFKPVLTSTGSEATCTFNIKRDIKQ